MAEGIRSDPDLWRPLALNVADDQRAQVCGAGHAVVRGLRVEVVNVLDAQFDGDAFAPWWDGPAGHGVLKGLLPHYRRCGCGT
jgi:hypothetical protein